MNIVLDTNCLIQILPRGSVNRWVFDALLQGQLTLSLTTEIVAEYEEVLNTFFESETLGADLVGVAFNKDSQYLFQLATNYR